MTWSVTNGAEALFCLAMAAQILGVLGATWGIIYISFFKWRIK